MPSKENPFSVGEKGQYCRTGLRGYVQLMNTKHANPRAYTGILEYGWGFIQDTTFNSSTQKKFSPLTPVMIFPPDSGQRQTSVFTNPPFASRTKPRDTLKVQWPFCLCCFPMYSNTKCRARTVRNGDKGSRQYLHSRTSNLKFTSTQKYSFVVKVKLRSRASTFRRGDEKSYR